ncbi:Putative galactoside 2-alpha-L-fucosyltransferase svh-11 [Caenorhabditis elegans]|uniref:Isoform b of Putative galactoside 2-alpha-L-fucosyltransferase svh-11 n=1 Tax=Caenorhabditis elegans TaxID=6239 RepID=Q966A0-2|nr:Putative galactoside 2-alpha-L-fucosyltransferase svh-11 [Caenorhabditis elegans]CUR30074.1 Putative galactoside 2-alpha-L-fucosyltransferase svh-11 [Caenorhabditis elegans]|eukprot:NP_001303775.1 Uncharacterized protein CELE_Y5H2B.1 [Caenorhabditis elegans]
MRLFHFLKFLTINNFSRYCLKIVKVHIIWITIICIIYFNWRFKKLDFMAIPYPPAVIKFNTSAKYLSSNLASSSQLGNNIFEIASLYGLSKHLNRTPLFFIENGYHKKMLDNLRKTMPRLMEKFRILNGSVPRSISETKFQRACCLHKSPWSLEKNRDEYLHLSGKYYQSWKYFPNMRNELIEFLNPTSIQIFGNLPISDDQNHVTCVHSRRGDFVEYLFYASDPKFMKNAVTFLNENEKVGSRNRKIVLFGDDLNFLETYFSDAVLSTDVGKNAEYYISQNPPIDDFLYSKNNCDVVLITETPKFQLPAQHSAGGLGIFRKETKFTIWILNTLGIIFLNLEVLLQVTSTHHTGRL